jgi:catechol 2,3-dioxygenase
MMATPPTRIHPDTRIGYVHLNVADLEGQLDLYQKVIGLQVHWQEGDAAGLGAGRHDLLRLTQVPEGRRYRGVTGIYHFAILLPDRRALARSVARLFALRYPNHPTDHVMTKTTYLDDPEGNNIELYTDTPEDGIFEFANGELVARHADGRPSNGREPLDVEALFRALQPGDFDQLEQPMPPATTIGHVHLYTASLEESMDFYHGVLGFDNMGIGRSFRMGMASAGGYHHHIGFTTWQGEGAPSPPSDALGLRNFSVVLPDERELEEVLGRVREAGIEVEEIEEGWRLHDPSKNALVLVSGSSRN